MSSAGMHSATRTLSWFLRYVIGIGDSSNIRARVSGTSGLYAIGTRQQRGELSYGRVIRPIGNSEKLVSDEACDSAVSSTLEKDRLMTCVMSSKYRHTALGLGRPCAHINSMASSNLKASSSMGRETNPIPPRDRARCATTNSKDEPSILHI